MKNLILILALLTVTKYTFGAVFGLDDRIDTRNVKNEIIKNAAKSSAALILKKRSSRNGDIFNFSSFKLSDENIANFCSESNFSHEQLIANCSSVLVGEDLVATAAHCLEKSLNMGCDDYLIVFDYISRVSNQESFSSHKDSVYSCKEVLYYDFDTSFSTGEDIALIRLDRKVSNRKPVKIVLEKVKKDTKIFMVGHPLGISQKISMDGYVLGIESDSSFDHNLDSFSVNSGSPIFDWKTGDLVGINVRGPAPNWVETENDCNDWHYGDENILAHQANFINIMNFHYKISL